MRLPGLQDEENGLKKGYYPSSRTDRDSGFLEERTVSCSWRPCSSPPFAYAEGQ